MWDVCVLKKSVQLLKINLNVFQICLIICFYFNVVSCISHNFHTIDGSSIYDIFGTDVFFEITEPKELAYTYKIRPAQDFGTTFNETFSVRNIPLVPADPSCACNDLFNAEELEGNIALVERGECSFLSKSLRAEKAGALAIIVSDYDKDNDELYIEMVDDNTLRPVNIPAGFLLGKNGERFSNRSIEPIELIDKHFDRGMTEVQRNGDGLTNRLTEITHPQTVLFTFVEITINPLNTINQLLFYLYIIRSTLERLNRRYALINLPINITKIPLNKVNQPPWLGW